MTLRRRREGARLSAHTVARWAGLRRQTVSDLENGQTAARSAAGCSGCRCGTSRRHRASPATADRRSTARRARRSARAGRRSSPLARRRPPPAAPGSAAVAGFPADPTAALGCGAGHLDPPGTGADTGTGGTAEPVSCHPLPRPVRQELCSGAGNDGGGRPDQDCFRSEAPEGRKDLGPVGRRRRGRPLRRAAGRAGGPARTARRRRTVTTAQPALRAAWPEGCSCRAPMPTMCTGRLEDGRRTTGGTPGRPRTFSGSRVPMGARVPRHSAADRRTCHPSASGTRPESDDATKDDRAPAGDDPHAVPADHCPDRDGGGLGRRTGGLPSAVLGARSTGIDGCRASVAAR